jgi:hypothetical protein
VRTAKDDVEIGGVNIARGQWVYASIGAANRVSLRVAAGATNVTRRAVAQETACSRGS